jgi:hypothetical protein
VQFITFAEVEAKTIGDPSFDLKVSSTADQPIVFDYPTSKISITEKTVTLKNPGLVKINAYAQGAAKIFTSPGVSQSFCINPAQPSITSTPGENKLTSSNKSGNQWFKNGNLLAGEDNQTFTFSGSGTYTVKTTVDGCSSRLSDEVQIVITETEQEKVNHYTFFPNPAHDALMINTNGARVEDASIAIYSVRGTQELDLTIDLSGKQAGVCDIRDLPPGMYFFQLKVDLKIVYTGKFSKI